MKKNEQEKRLDEVQGSDVVDVAHIEVDSDGIEPSGITGLGTSSEPGVQVKPQKGKKAKRIKEKKVKSEKVKGIKGPKMKNNHQKIRTQIAVVIVLILSLSMILSGFINYTVENKTVSESAKHDNLALALTLAKQAETFVTNSKNTVKTTMSALDFASMDATTKQISLSKVIVNNSEIKDIFTVTMEGKVEASTRSNDHIGTDVSSEEWFQKAKGGFLYISDAFIEPSSKLATFLIAQPVESTTSGRTGVVVTTIRLDKLNGMIKGIQVGETGYIYMMDKSGTIIGHKDFTEVVMKLVSAKTVPSFVNGSKAKDFKALEKENVEKKRTGFVMDSNVTAEYLGLNKTNVVGSYFRVPTIGWIVVVEQSTKELNAKGLASLLRIGLATLAFILIGLVISFVYASTISKPLQTMVVYAGDIRDGNLQSTLQVTEKNEIGVLQVAINDMALSLKNLIMSINLTTEQVRLSAEELNHNASRTNEASGHISHIIQEVAEGTQQQISAVEEGRRTISDMSQSINLVAENSMEILKSSSSAASLAENGRENIDRINAMMETINAIVGNTAKMVSELNGSVQDIGGIVEFIRDISKKTNLLALNASIEAARAGEHGRGFTVVADEVKKLAEQSSKATEDISKRITQIQKETKVIVSSMEASMVEVQGETKVIEDTATSFMNIIAETHKVQQEIETFTASMQELASGVHVVETSVDAVVDISYRTSGEAQNVLANIEEQIAAIQQMTDSIMALSMLSEELESTVKAFKI